MSESSSSFATSVKSYSATGAVTDDELSAALTPGGEFGLLVSAVEFTSTAADWVAVMNANGLPKRSMFRVPDAFVVVSVDGVEKFATTTTRKTLNPHWNEHFDVYASPSTERDPIDDR